MWLRARRMNISNLSIVVSTVIEHSPSHRLLELIRLARNPAAEVAVVIQTGNGELHGNEWGAFKDNAENLGVRIAVQSGKGLSRSRNEAIRLAGSRWIYFCDDDVEPNLTVLLNLAERADQHGLDILAFRVAQAGRDYKKYPSRETRIGIHNAAKLHSANIIVRRSFVEMSGVLFPEDMGLGTDMPTGEEYVFLAGLLRAGARGAYVPVVAVEHPDVSSGQSFPRDIRDIIAKRRMFDRIFGKRAWFYRLIFALKKTPRVIGRVPIRSYFDELVWKRGG